MWRRPYQKHDPKDTFAVADIIGIHAGKDMGKYFKDPKSMFFFSTDCCCCEEFISFFRSARHTLLFDPHTESLGRSRGTHVQTACQMGVCVAALGWWTLEDRGRGRRYHNELEKKIQLAPSADEEEYDIISPTDLRPDGELDEDNDQDDYGDDDEEEEEEEEEEQAAVPAVPAVPSVPSGKTVTFTPPAPAQSAKPAATSPVPNSERATSTSMFSALSVFGGAAKASASATAASKAVSAHRTEEVKAASSVSSSPTAAIVTPTTPSAPAKPATAPAKTTSTEDELASIDTDAGSSSSSGLQHVRGHTISATIVLMAFFSRHS